MSQVQFYNSANNNVNNTNNFVKYTQTAHVFDRRNNAQMTQN